MLNAEELAKSSAVEPVYGLTEGLFQRAVAARPAPPEWIGEETLEKLRLPGFAEALGAMHRPKAPEDVDPAGPALTPLAYDELHAISSPSSSCGQKCGRSLGRAHVAEGALGKRLEAALPSR